MENFGYQCTYTTLHHAACGYVVQCDSCKGFQLAFGNIMLCLLPPEFDAFFDYVKGQHQRVSVEMDQERKNILIPTHSDKLTMVFTGTEIIQLYDLMQQAKMMQQVYQTLTGEADQCA